MNIGKVILDKILVKVDPVEEKTVSGIIIPNKDVKNNQGEVVAVGTGLADEPMYLKVGDRVMFGEYSGREITVGEDKFLVLKQKEVDFIFNQEN